MTKRTYPTPRSPTEFLLRVTRMGFSTSILKPERWWFNAPASTGKWVTQPTWNYSSCSLVSPITLSYSKLFHGSCVWPLLLSTISTCFFLFCHNCTTGKSQSKISILLHRRCKSLSCVSWSFFFYLFFFQKQDSYKLTIIASDLNGQPGGNTGTGEVTVKIQDINDNVPTLDRDSVGVQKREKKKANK